MARVPSTDGGEFEAYLAVPAAGSAPGVVVLQEIFGANKNMRAVCDWLASEGFLAACPDLYWRMEPGLEMDESQRDRARELGSKLDQSKVAEDIGSTMEFLKRQPKCSGRVGTVGFCLGGRLAYLSAVRKKPNAAVSYYGVGIDTVLAEAGNLSCPMLMHFAELDKFTPPAAIDAIRGALAEPRVTIQEYAGCDHAFARKGGANYNAEAAELANARTLAFLRQSLGGAG